MTLEEWKEKGYEFKRWWMVDGELRPEFTVTRTSADLDMLKPGTMIRVGKRTYAIVR